MSGTVIGIATENHSQSAEWAQIIGCFGHRVYRILIGSPLPEHQVHLWLVIPNPRTAPNRFAFWLRRISERIVLVTPHMAAGQYLASWAPSLSLVSAPQVARTALGDVLALAHSTGCYLAAQGIAQVHSC